MRKILVHKAQRVRDEVEDLEIVIGGYAGEFPDYSRPDMVAGRGKDEADLEWILVESKAKYTDVRRVMSDYLGKYAATELDAQLDLARWQKKRKR